MMENFSGVWGGSGDVLLPVDGDSKAHPALLSLIGRFDPDRLGFYFATRRAQQMSDPEAFKVWLESTAQKLATESQDMTVEDAKRQLLDGSFLSWPLNEWRPSKELEAQILRMCSPVDEEPFDHTWQADGQPGREFLQVANIKECLEVQQCLSIRASNIDPRIDLMLVSRIGALSPTLTSALENGGMTVVRVEAEPSQLSQVLDLAWEPDVAGIKRTIEFITMIGDQDVPPLAVSDLFEHVPFRLSEVGCSWYVTGLWNEENPSVVVVGDEADDYSLSLLLDRMYRQAYWYPASLAGKDDELAEPFRMRLANRLNASPRHGPTRDDAPILVTSVSLDHEAVEAAARALVESDLWRGSLVDRLQFVEPEALPRPKPIRLYDSERMLTQRYEPFIGQSMAGALDTPRPSGVTPVSPYGFSPASSHGGFTWHVDVLIDRLAFPPRSALSPLMAEAHFTGKGHVRASSDGHSYFSQEQYFIPAGASIEQATYKPRLKRVDATDAFKALLEAEGLRGEVSQAGKYSEGIMLLWSGLERLAADFRDPVRNALLEAFRKRTKSGEDPGVFLQASRRRYLSLRDARKATGIPRGDVRALVDDYVGRGILARGLCLKCPRCNNAAWYAIEDLGQRFRCGRCRAESWITLETWRMPAEPDFFYQLDEIAFQAINNDVRAPILALDELRKASRSSAFAREMDVFDDSRLIAEIDILGFVGGELLVGEAKTIDHLGENGESERAAVKKLLRISKTLGSRELVLATTSPAWSVSTLDLVRELAPLSLRIRELVALGQPR